MARTRTIKPEFFTSEDIVSMTPLARLFYVSLWCESDREGRLEWKPKTFKLRYLPGDNVDIEELAQELIQSGVIVLYEVDGKTYAEIPTFTKHQIINNRESESKIPPRVNDCFDASGTRESGVKAEGKGKEGKGREGKGLLQGEDAPVASDADDLPAHQTMQTESLLCPVQKIVDAYHDLMPDNPRIKVLDDARRKTIASRWKQAAKLQTKPFGYTTVEEGLKAWRTFFEVCNDSDFLTGKAPAGIGRTKPFIADLDFLLSPKGFKGCLENKYHRDAA